MKKGKLIGKIFGIVFVFVMIGAMLPLGAFGSQSQVKASPAIIHVGDDYVTIQAAKGKANSSTIPYTIDSNKDNYPLVGLSESYGTAATSPWPMFHHDPQRTGRSPYTGPETPCIKWSFGTAGPGQSSPAIGPDGTVYISSMDNNLYAINPDGTLKWSYNTGGGGYSSPAISSDGTIYVGSRDKKLYAISPEGKLKWYYQTNGCVNSHPAIDPDGTIYFGSYDGYLYAINPDSTLKWVYYVGWSCKTPAIGADGTIYVLSGAFSVGEWVKLYALNPDGSLKWIYDTRGVSCCPAIGADGTIYFGCFSDDFYALNPDGTVKWTFSAGDSILPAPAIGLDGTIYFGSNDHKFYALNADGSLKWWRLTEDDIYSSAVIGADGTIYFSSFDGYLYAFKPDSILKWRIKAGRYVYSSPAMGADGTIYVGGSGVTLYAIGKAEASPATIYVPDNYPTIQAAVNAANPGDTIIVRDGTYIENVNVNKDHLTIQSENGATRTIVQTANPTSTAHVFAVRADYVTISGFTVRKARWDISSIEVGYCYYCCIENNDAQGIFLGSAKYNIIRKNRSSNSWAGIYLENSSNNNLYMNDLVDNSANVVSYHSSTDTWRSSEEITYTYNGNTYKSYLGNYWSDYSGSDADGDGIGDIPYPIGSDADSYPLMEPFENYESSVLSYSIYHTDTPVGELPNPDMDIITPIGLKYGNVIDIFRSGELIARLDAGMIYLWVFDGDESRMAVLGVEYREMYNGAWHLPVQSNPTIKEYEGKYVLSVDSKSDDDAMISHYTITISEDGAIYFDKNTTVPNPLPTDECSAEDGLVGIHLVDETVGDEAHVEVYDDGVVYSWDIPSVSGYGNIDTSHTLEHGDWLSATGSGINAAIKFQVDSTSGYDNWGNPSSLAAVIQYGPGKHIVLVGRKDVEMWNPTVLPAGEYSIKGWLSVISVSQPHAPLAHASDISGQPQVMYPDTEYTVTAKYFDPDGREDLKYCYLQLKHPDKSLTMMWNQATDDFWVYAGEEGANYLTVTGNPTEITEGVLEGYELAWTFVINHQWPEVENTIDFGVYAWDDGDLTSGWDYDDSSVSFVVPSFLPTLTSPLSITPDKETYEAGETLTAQFAIKNQGAMPFTLDVLTAGGRCNGWCMSSGCPDFPHYSVALQPGETYQYEGDFILPKSGDYLFFVAYYIDSPTPDEAKLLDQNNWNTSINLGTGLRPQDRIRTIIVPQTEEEADLSAQINRLLDINIQYPPYLLTPEGFQMSVAIVWMNWTAWATQTELNEKYDELYLTGVDYDCTSRIALANAKAALDRGDIEIAREYVQDYFLYNRLSLMSFDAATYYFLGMAGAAEILAEGVRDGCQAAVKFGLTFVSPAAAKAADYFFIGSDFVVDYYFRGQDEALKDALVKAAITALFSEIKLAPGGRTLENYIANRIGKVTFPLLQTWIRSGEWQFFLMRSLKYAAEWLSEEVAVEVASLILDELGQSSDRIESHVKSPVELLVYDSQGNAAGLLNGQVEHGISRSMYDNEMVTIFFPSGLYTYSIIGKDEGVYGLEVVCDEEGSAANFNAIDIPISVPEVHRYTIDWDALSQGEEGVTVQIDSDGDGDFEETIVTSQPNMPSNPSPVSHVSGVPIDVDLGWIGGDPDAGDTVTYGVYLGTSETPPLRATIGPYPATQSSITYAPGTLVDGATYYWNIVARDNHGITREGPVWDFTVGQPGPAVIWNCPLGGEPLIAPNPGKGRPDLTVPTACDGITASAGAELWGIYYLVETGPQAGTWLWYIPGFVTSTLTQLELGELYWLVVSDPCTLTIPQ